MKTHTIILAATIGLLAFPLAAQDTKPCNEDTIGMVMEQIETAPELAKGPAMAELEMAKTKMSEGEVEACSIHVTNASNLATSE